MVAYPLVVNVSQHSSNHLNREDQQEAEEILWMTQDSSNSPQMAV